MTFLIVGLGNPGPQYAQTRHNVGFLILDTMADHHKLAWQAERHSWHSAFRLQDHTVHLIKPTTFMNHSGLAVRHWRDYLQLANKNLLVVVDDLALPFGTLRLRIQGSHGNHNGLLSIEQHLGTTHYPRLRFGIGNQYEKGKQVEYVLGTWNEHQQPLLPAKLALSCRAIESFVLFGMAATMSVFNRKQPPPAQNEHDNNSI